jgi:uncharacterized protein YbjT (DUF2867 family)
MSGSTRQVLLTGATGFVGRHLWPELERHGCSVRGLTRDAQRACERWPERDWRQADAADAARVAEAAQGCEAAYYLVHGMSEGHGDFHRREIECARSFAQAMDAAGVRRVVYLGGMEPPGEPSEHLRSRLEVGALLRESIETVELRASMIVGHGSLSWLIVRDLAARLPCMVLPRWLKSRTQPVALQDVIAALIAALDLPLRGSEWFDLPGPEALPAKEIMFRIARVMGMPAPRTVEVPVLSPWLSSHWVRFVTRADWSVAREVVLGLDRDLLAHDDRYWRLAGHTELMPFDEAARLALLAEQHDGPVSGRWGAIERWMASRSYRRARA